MSSFSLLSGDQVNRSVVMFFFTFFAGEISVLLVLDVRSRFFRIFWTGLVKTNCLNRWWQLCTTTTEVTSKSATYLFHESVPVICTSQIVGFVVVTFICFKHTNYPHLYIWPTPINSFIIIITRSSVNRSKRSRYI